jgi:predicted transcriptional regulator of viral defense system
VEQELALRASGAHGLVTRAELLRGGVTPDEIKHRVRVGALIREHRGVYRVGHRAPSVEARYLAAVLACGPGALLSGPAAAHLLGLTKGPAPRPQVTGPTERRVRGVATRRSRVLHPRDGTVVRGIPVTTIPRTVVDLAATLGLDDLARAFHEAAVRYRTTPAQVDAVLARLPRSRGARGCRYPGRTGWWTPAVWTAYGQSSG